MRAQVNNVTKITFIALALGLSACGVRGELVAPTAQAALGT